ncbi:MAG TPA: TolC family protein [Candidatus Solibacter sp.]|nr:TolC family protein [Candidatus Solibacter sp.]
MLFRPFLAGIILTAGAFAQLTSFPKPNYFRETFNTTKTKVELKDPVKLKDYVHNGKLELSLKDYLALVMANNTDIQLQNLTLEAPKNAIQRAFGVWDPVAQASFTSTRSTSPSTNVLDGAAEIKQLSQPLNMSVTQLLPAGTNYTVSWGGSKTTTNSSFNNYNPALSSNLQVSFSQPLLRNRGTYVNKLSVMIARSRLRVSEYGLRNTMINLISAAENAYWDVVSARESLKVAEGARNVSAEFLKLSQKQLDLGALSPLDIYNPQQSLAQNEVAVAQARFRVTQFEDALRKQIGVDLDPDIRNLPIELTDTAEMPTDSIKLDREQGVQTALQNRPDLKQATQSLDSDDLSIQSAKNALLPNLALTGNYLTNGRGGTYIQRTNVFNQGVSSSVITVLPGGLGDALGQMFGFGFGSYQFGLRLTLPIRSRAASADLADAIVRKKQDALTVRSTQQTIRLDVLNAITNVESSKESVNLAKVARDYAQKALDAENKKYELGTELQQNVLLAANALATSESTLVTNQIALRRNLLNLLMKLGTLLDERGIVVQ